MEIQKKKFPNIVTISDQHHPLLLLKWKSIFSFISEKKMILNYNYELTLYQINYIIVELFEKFYEKPKNFLFNNLIKKQTNKHLVHCKHHCLLKNSDATYWMSFWHGRPFQFDFVCAVATLFWVGRQLWNFANRLNQVYWTIIHQKKRRANLIALHFKNFFFHIRSIFSNEWCY